MNDPTHLAAAAFDSLARLSPVGNRGCTSAGQPVLLQRLTSEEEP